MPFKFSAYTYPGSSSYEKLFDIPVAMPGSSGVLEMSAWSDDSFMVPASFSRLPDLEDNGGWIVVSLEGKIVTEFDAARTELTAGRPSTRTISGPQRNGLVEGIGVAPKGYPNHIAGAFDHIWGGEGILEDLDLGALGSIREEWEVWHDHTSGAWNADVDGDDADIPHDASANDVEGRSETLDPPGVGLQGLTTVDDVTVSGSGTQADPYVIVFYAPPTPTVTITAGTLSGGSTFSATKTVAGALDPSPITVSKPVDAGAGAEDVHGEYDIPAIEVVTDNLDVGADWALKVNATARYAGTQIPRINVIPGQTYSGIKVRVKPETTADFVLVMHDLAENRIAQTTPRDQNLAAGSYQDLVIDEATIPAGVNQVILRVAITDANPANIDDFYVNWQGAVFREGEAETTWTAIVSHLLGLAQDRGVATYLEADVTDSADTLGNALDDIAYTAFAGDNAHLGQVLGDGAGRGYQWQVVPASEAQVITPAAETTHVLQIFKVDADEVEDTTSDPGGPAVTVGAKGVNKAQVVSRRSPYTTLIGLGLGSLSAEDTDSAAEAIRGRIERIRDVEQLGSTTTIQEYLTAQFAETDLNLKAAAATVLETASHIPGVDYGPLSKIWWQFPGILDKEARPVKRISWTHGMTARFKVEGSRILTGPGAVVAAVDYLLRQAGRRRSEHRPPAATSDGGGGVPRIVIATFGASALSKSKADLQADGSNDADQLTAAIEDYGTSGEIRLTEGVLELGSTDFTFGADDFLTGAGQGASELDSSGDIEFTNGGGARFLSITADVPT